MPEPRSLAQLKKRGRWLRLGKKLGGERLLFLVGRLLAGLQIEGQDTIPAQGACLFVFNHVSQPADLLVNALIRHHRPGVYLFGIRDLQGEMPLASFLQAMGEPDAGRRLLGVYKARGLAAGELFRAYHLLLQGEAISIAPEGEYTWDGRLQRPLQPGAAWLALRTGAPVVPVVSRGGYDMQPRWQMERIRLPGRLTIRAGPPFHLSPTPLGQVKDEILDEANQRLWEVMATLLE